MGKTVATGIETPQPYPQLPEHVMDMFSLKGKVASVTGASGGIGYEVAVAFAQAGANVAMWYNSHSIEEEAEKLSKKYNVTVKAYKCSLTDTKAVEETVQQIKKDFGGRIDIMQPRVLVQFSRSKDQVLSLQLVRCLVTLQTFRNYRSHTILQRLPLFICANRWLSNGQVTPVLTLYPQVT